MSKLLFVMSQGLEKAGGATRTIQFASIAAEKGNQVEVVLVDDAVYWALFGMAEGIRSTTGDNMKELLDTLIELKAPIYICKACADKRLLDPDDCLPGTEIKPGPDLVDKMADPEYKVFTF
jgi:predicted peroxiredoxin